MSAPDLRADLDAIDLDPDTLDALAIATAVQSLRQQAVTREGRSASRLLARVADRLEGAVHNRVRPDGEES